MVHVSTYQGNPFGGYPIFDPQPNEYELFCLVGFKANLSLLFWSRGQKAHGSLRKLIYQVPSRCPRLGESSKARLSAHTETYCSRGTFQFHSFQGPRETTTCVGTCRGIITFQGFVRNGFRPSIVSLHCSWPMVWLLFCWLLVLNRVFVYHTKGCEDQIGSALASTKRRDHWVCLAGSWEKFYDIRRKDTHLCSAVCVH